MTNASYLAGSSASSWLPDTAKASVSWLSMDILASRAAVPLYIALGFWLVQRLPSLLERLFTPKATPSTSAWVVPAETRHARFLPAESQHAFRYNTLYLAIRLDKLETRKLDTGHAFAWKGPVLQPEFVDEGALAAKKNVTPAAVGSQSDGKEDWKAKMRAAERIERRRLEEKRGRNDRYTWSLTGLHPSGYLRTHLPSSDEPSKMTKEKGAWITGSILLKLAYELRERGFLSVGPQDSDTHVGGADWRHELGHVWTVTMPSIAGITGINPLTVHYCYRPHGFGTDQAKGDPDERGDFWLVVLEVHNTFSERHIYVLEAGKNEDGSSPDAETGVERRAGYDHQWTFARSFHVSPFNDRGGYYRLFLKEPFAQAAEPTAFVLGIRLLLLVEAQDAVSSDDARPKLVKKLMATLDSIAPKPAKQPSASSVGRCVRPLSPATLYAALLRQPVDLFLTFFRILYEAGKLHFQKRLDAFGRPDMVQLAEPCADTFNGEGLPPPVNRIQPHRAASASIDDASVGLVYPEAGWAEKVAKDYVQSMLERRIGELEQVNESWCVEVVSTDPADSGIRVESEADGNKRNLVLYTRSYGVYVDLMTHRPPQLALLLGGIVGRRWGVSSRADFESFFAGSPPLDAATGVRKRHLHFLLSSARIDYAQASKLLERFGIATSSASAASAADGSNREDDGWRVSVALWLGYAAALAEKKAFAWLGARYVKGTEPWMELHRGLEHIAALEQADKEPLGTASWDTKLGSVYHP